jgi:hypothetical protein
MTWELIAKVGSAELKLGDPRAAVRERFGEARTFRRTPDAPETDQFVDAGLLVTYDNDERVTFIEFTPPASPTVAGVTMIGRSLRDVLAELRDRDVIAEADPDGAVVPDWKVGMYAPGERVEGVSVG